MKSMREGMPPEATRQAAECLLIAVHKFLQRNRAIGSGPDLALAPNVTDRRSKRSAHQFRRAARAYEAMGMIIATWYTHPEFLDSNGQPTALSINGRVRSLSSLIRRSRCKLTRGIVLDLFQRSSSIGFTSDGLIVALKRDFHLPGFELIRAALWVERFLDTIQRNLDANFTAIKPVMEMSCYVSDVNAKRVAPLLRDIRQKGAAFMDSVDGAIEWSRVGRKSDIGIEVGACAFAWTRGSQRKSNRKASRTQRRRRATETN